MATPLAFPNFWVWPSPLRCQWNYSGPWSPCLRPARPRSLRERPAWLGTHPACWPFGSASSPRSPHWGTPFPADLSPSLTQLSVFIPSLDLSPTFRLSHPPAHVCLPRVSAGTSRLSRQELSFHLPPSVCPLATSAPLQEKMRLQHTCCDDLLRNSQSIQQVGR